MNEKEITALELIKALEANKPYEASKLLAPYLNDKTKSACLKKHKQLNNYSSKIHLDM